MADAENDPFAKFVMPSGSTPGEDPNDPFAKFAKSGSVGEDLVKGVPTGLAQGVIGLAGTPGDLQNVAKAGSDVASEHGLNPFSWLGDKFANSKLGKFLQEDMEKHPDRAFGTGDVPGSYQLPSSGDIQGAIEKLTGPFYQSKTPVGKGIQTAAQVLPSIAAGGDTLPGVIAKSIGAGATSEGAGEAADSLKGYLPDAAQPWAEPVARGVGAVVGTGLPWAARKITTPNPATPEQAASVTAVKAKDPDFPMSAGQATDKPGLRGIEAYSPKMQAIPGQQADAFTRGTMQEMGVDGLATPQNIAHGRDIGTEIGQIRKNNEINTTEFPQLNKDIGKIVNQYKGVVGKQNTQLISGIQDEIKQGAMGGPTANASGPLSMTGPRYSYMRQRLQSAIDAAGTGTDSDALSAVRKSLDDAFHRSISPGDSARLKQLETQYANYNVLTNKKPTGEETMSPQEVSAAVSKTWGAPSVNENRGTLAPWAYNASKVMQPIAVPTPEAAGPFTKLAGMGAGWLLGHSDPAVGAIVGREAIGPVVDALKSVAGRVAGSKTGQAYLGNQAWLPGSNSTMDKATALRLLMSPPVKQLPPAQQSE
jgi:hypothetical protein